MARLEYADGEAVELGDNVAFYMDDTEFEGQIASYQPKRRTAKIRWRDHFNTNRDGSAKLVVTTMPIEEVDLLRREC